MSYGNTPEYKHQWYLKHRDLVRARNKKYQLEHPEVHRKACRKEYWKHKDKKMAYAKIYQKEYKKRPEVAPKVFARKKFTLLVHRGKIIRQFCEIPGCKVIGEGHHDDYSKPLDVRYVCRKHHFEYHQKLKAQLAYA